MSVAAVSMGVRPNSVRSSATSLLVFALVLATGWAVLAGGWSEALGSALLVGLAGMLEMLLLARGRVSRLLALLSAPLLLFATLLPGSFGSRPQTAAGFPHLIGQYAGAAATGLLGNAAWEFNVGLSALLWVCGAWAAWFAIREHSGALACAPCWAVVAVNVINAPNGGQVGVPATAAAVAAIALIAAVHLDRLNQGWMRRRVPVLPGTDGRFATAAAVGGGLIVVLALIVPPLTSTDLSSRFFGLGGSAGGGGHARSGSPSGVGAEGTVRFNPATVPGGPLTLADSPVLVYTSSTAGGVYLRMATDGVFDSGNWLPDQSALNNGDFAQVLVNPGSITRDRLLVDGGVGAGRQPASINVSLTDDTSGDNVLPFPGEPDGSTLAARVNGLAAPEFGQQLITVDSVQAVQQIAGTSFVTTATQSTASVAELRAAGENYPAFLQRDQFIDLPDDGTGGAKVIRALAQQWTQTDSNPYDKATRIENMLRDPHLFHYTLNPPLPSLTQQVWPVTYFLTTTHSGYCQYFATAMGAMLRALGIPARLVNGYGPGTAPNSAARGVDAEAIYQVSSNDAHTWVEAYFPGYGWVPFEPTPPSQAGDYKPFVRGSTSTAPTATASPSKPATPRATARSGPPLVATTPGGGAGPSPLVTGTAAGGVVILVMVALFTAWFLRPRGVGGIWRRMGVVGMLAGVRRDPSVTFDEYVQRLSAALPPRETWAAADLSDLALLSGRALYSQRSLQPDESMRMRVAWRRIARLLPRLGWRALRQRSVTP